MTKYIQLEIRDQVYTINFDAMMKGKELPAEVKEDIRHQVEDLGKNYILVINEREMN